MEPEPDVQSTLPLTEATFFILLSLAPGPKHGYAIMKEVSEMSRGRVAFSTGTLYGAIKRLLDQRWIERIGEDPDEAEEMGRPRKAYVLTSLGKRIMAAEVVRMQDLVHLAVAARSQEA
jgi:DNA-binding PadR family transcriptional regulator